MDEEDVRICRALIIDSRISYDDLARELDMSIPAVHKRLKGLVESGVVQAFTAGLDIAALGGTSAMVYGHSPLASVQEAADRLRMDGRTWLILVSGGGMMHCMAFLRKGEPLEDYISVVRCSLSMEDAQGHLHLLRPGGRRLGTTEVAAPTTLEIRILRAMKDDSRRRASEMAEDLGVSARTINKKLVSMRKEGKAVFTIRWSADYSKEAVALVHLRLGAEGRKAHEAVPILFNRFQKELVILSAFQDRPDLLVCTVWGENMRGIGAIAQRMMSEIGAEGYGAHPIFEAQHMECWKD